MHEVWAFPIIIIGPMVQWLLSHWILETKQQQKPNEHLAKALIQDNIT